MHLQSCELSPAFQSTFGDGDFYKERERDFFKRNGHYISVTTISQMYDVVYSKIFICVYVLTSASCTILLSQKTRRATTRNRASRLKTGKRTLIVVAPVVSVTTPLDIISVTQLSLPCDKTGPSRLFDHTPIERQTNIAIADGSKRNSESSFLFSCHAQPTNTRSFCFLRTSFF
jgi:hypothetical protein